MGLAESPYLAQILLVYAISFFVLAAVAFLQPRADETLAFATDLWLLGVFALLQGVLESANWWHVALGIPRPETWLTPALLFSAYVCLFEFGRRVLAWVSHEAALRLRWFYLVIVFAPFGMALYGEAGIPGFMAGTSYFVGLPAAWLTAYALWQFAQAAKNNTRPIKGCIFLHLAALSFLAYGILAGWVVSAYSQLPAGMPTMQLFFSWTGTPIYLYRAGAALLIALGVAVALRQTNIWAGVRARNLADALVKSNQALESRVQERTQALEIASLAIAQSEARYRNIIETAEEGIWQIDENSRTAFVNRKMADMLGYSVSEMLGETMFKFMDDAGRAIAEKNVERRKEGIAEQHEFEFMRKDGNRIWTLLNTSVLMDAEGRYQGALAMVSDITTRKRAEQALRAQQTALFHLSADPALYEGEARAAFHFATREIADVLDVERVSVWLYDDDGRALRCNNLYQRSLDRHSEGMLLQRSDYPGYFEAIEQGRVIVATDAHRNAATSEFSAYFTPLGVQSMLDANIRVGGHVVGVLCLQSVGMQREWTMDEQLFVASAADLLAIAISVSSQRQSAADLIEQQSMLSLAQEVGGFGSWWWDIPKNRLVWSEQAYRIYGFDPGMVETADGIWQLVDQVLHPEDKERVYASKRTMLETGQSEEVIAFRIVRPDGQVRMLVANTCLERDADGMASYCYGTLRDVTTERAEEEQLIEIARGVSAQTGLRFFESLALHLATVLQADYAFIGQLAPGSASQVQTLAVYANGALIDNFSYDLQGTPCENVVGRDSCAYLCDVQNLFPSDEMLMQMGVNAYVGTPLFTSSGKALGLITVLYRRPLPRAERIMSTLQIFAARAAAEVERTHTQARLEHLAQHDSLTDLPNRLLYLDRLGHAISGAQRRNQVAAVLFLDLDRFKHINDTFGHEMGDKFLQQISMRLKQHVRSGDSVARFGGDEFAVLLEDMSNVADVTPIAEKILEALAIPFEIDDREFFVTTSMGISLYPADGLDAQTLLKHADVAMYRAKDLGRNNFQFYSAELSARALERLTVETRLRHALERQEFFIYYQPQVDLRTRRLLGLEALLRWRDAELGMVSPAQFIPVAEETGLIIPIGEWVLAQVCAQAAAWSAAGLDFGRVTVNLSGRQFADPRLAQHIAKAIRAAGLAPDMIELEITEGVVMHNPESAVGVLNALRDSGVRIAVDDFGIGYSSLSYLKRFPIDTLKVDQSFVRDIVDDPNDASIVKAIIAMSHSMGLEVIAEGVETEQQLAFLRQHQCDAVQGYLFARPLPAHDAEAIIRRGFLTTPAQPGNAAS